jgi:hypothetical protein
MNPYEPPRAQLKRRNDAPGSLPKAVVIGVLIDISGTLIVGFAAAIIYGIVLGARGYSEDAIARAFEELDPWSAFGLFTSFLGMLVSAFAGYQCARIANRPGYLAPGILAMISCAFGAALGGDLYSQLELLALSGLTVIAVLGGASVYLRQMQSG